MTQPTRDLMTRCRRPRISGPDAACFRRYVSGSAVAVVTPSAPTLRVSSGRLTRAAITRRRYAIATRRTARLGRRGSSVGDVRAIW